MKITICHQALHDASSPDEVDVLEQVRAVEHGLRALGHQTSVLACTLNLDALKATWNQERPELVWNLVESLDERGEWIHLVPSLLDALAIPYTGASAFSLLLSSNKLLAKRNLAASGLPTPREFPAEGVEKFLVKSVWEHASRGLDPDSLTQTGGVASVIRERERSYGGRFFAEEYIDGREFNVALLASEGTPQVLPVAEIAFDTLPANLPRIVDYAAKWDTSSVQYQHTVRRFAQLPTDRALHRELEALALRCWSAFELNGYARVDFRVGLDGTIAILEVNANPCLAPDAGFAAALGRADISFPRALERIANDALARFRRE